jgi:hypothetical protein
MASSARFLRPAVFGLGALLLGALSAFFVFYAARLLYVTRGLSAIRAGGRGAYAGAFAFPLLALILGWGAWRCARTARRA